MNQNFKSPQTLDHFISFLLELRVGEMYQVAISKVAVWWSEACLVTAMAKMAKNLHRERTSQCIAGCADKRAAGL